MKICPTCKQTYSDESLNFCLSDGSVLNQLQNDPNSEPTVFFGQSPTTNANATPPPTAINQIVPQFNQGISPNFQQRPQKKSKAWVWVLAICGVLVVLGGIGFLGLIALVASNTPSSNVSVKNSNSKSPTPDDSDPENVQSEDFSKWRTDSNEYGTSEYSNGEFILTSKKVGFFYVLISSDEDMKTSDASTKITVRNVNGTLTKTGYGLLVHSEKDSPLEKDYGFLLDSAKQSFRIVQHTSRKETILKDWTRLQAIRSGTQTNEIEVKDQGGKMSMYVNGQFAATVSDSVNNQNGIFGIYAGDSIPIAFSDLVISK